MSLNLNRRQFVLGSAAVLAQMGISNPLSAQAQKLSVPTVDSLTIRVITDSTYDTPRAGGNKWVKVRRSGFISQTDYRKALHNEWGLSLALESKIGTDTRHLMLDFGYTPNALMNNMDIMGIDGAKMQGLIMSHGHFDHFGGLLGYLEKFRTKLPGDLTLYVGGEDNFCNRKTGSGTPGHFSDWGVLDRRDLEKHRVKVVSCEQPTVVLGLAFTTGTIERKSFERVLPNTQVEYFKTKGVGCDIPAANAKAGSKAKGDADLDLEVDLSAAADDQLDGIDTAAAAKAAKDAKAKALASIKVGPKGVYTEDSIRVYLQEIGRIRLLRPDEEIELARKIADLLQLEELASQFEVDHGHHPDTKEWAVLVDMPVIKFRRRLMLGRRAKEKMVQSNLRLVVSIAKKYMNRGLSFQDLIQEGSLGLIRAAEKFDHEKGYKFSTYATWWIRQAITRAIADQSRTIRLPVHLYETISRIKKTTKVLSQEFGRKPTEEEIAESMEMTIEKLRFIAKSAQLPISLETPIGKEEDSRLGDFIEADIENPDQDVAKNLLREDLEGVLATLSPRERDVLRLRYGLDDGRMKTLEEIGQIFDVTRERIRQIEAKALRKLRHPNRNGVLKEYIK